MNSVLLTAKGKLVFEGKPVDAKPLMVLNAALVLEAKCTLRSLFRMIETYPVYEEINPFWSEHLAQYRTCSKLNSVDSGLDHLLLTKTIEMIGFPGEPRLDIYHSLHGIQGKEMLEIRFFTMETILDLPLRLGKLKHVVFGDSIDLFEFETVYTLFEVIDAIAWELSFHGSQRACELRR